MISYLILISNSTTPVSLMGENLFIVFLLLSFLSIVFVNSISDILSAFLCCFETNEVNGLDCHGNMKLSFLKEVAYLEWAL